MNSNKKLKEIKLALRKHSLLNDAGIKEQLIDHIKKELVLKLKKELDFIVNEEVDKNTGYRTYEVGVSFLCINIPRNEEELLGIIKLLLEKYSNLKSK